MSAPIPETFAPDGYRQSQKQLIDFQRTCWGFHAPELKKHPLCDSCTVLLLAKIAQTERDRAAAFVEAHGHPELAALLRRMP